MSAEKHARPRDLPHPRGKSVKHFTETERARARAAGVVPRRAIRKADGSSMPTTANATVAPRRPPICMLFPDIAEAAAPAGMFGMFPQAFIGKVLPWLRAPRAEVLHVCSGALPPGEGIRVDMRPEARPDILADGRSLPLADGSAAAVLIDPPYSEHYARELYGVEYPLPSHLLREAARVVRHGGRIGFVHYLVPNPPLGCHHVKTFGLSMGFGYPMRAVTIYEREQASLPLGTPAAEFGATTAAPAPIPPVQPAPSVESGGSGNATGDTARTAWERAANDSNDCQGTSGEAAPVNGSRRSECADATSPCEAKGADSPSGGLSASPAKSAPTNEGSDDDVRNRSRSEGNAEREPGGARGLERQRHVAGAVHGRSGDHGTGACGDIQRRDDAAFRVDADGARRPGAVAVQPDGPAGDRLGAGDVAAPSDLAADAGAVDVPEASGKRTADAAETLRATSAEQPNGGAPCNPPTPASLDPHLALMPQPVGKAPQPADSNAPTETRHEALTQSAPGTTAPAQRSAVAPKRLDIRLVGADGSETQLEVAGG